MELSWDERGLVAAVAQDAATGRVLMLAWMNQEALDRTVESGYAHFYSRSRQALWKKGETSGNTLRVEEVRADCDRDAVLLLVTPSGPACHTGKGSCFFRRADGGEDDGPPGGVIDRLDAVLVARRDSSSPASSYTRSLLDGGAAKIAAKIEEEQRELCDELPGGEARALVHETADLWFHTLVGLVHRAVPAVDVLRELARRFGVGGHDEKASRGD